MIIFSITAKATLIPNTKIFFVFSVASYFLELAFPVGMGVMGNLLHSTSFSAVCCFSICNELRVHKKGWYKGVVYHLKAVYRKSILILLGCPVY